MAADANLADVTAPSLILAVVTESVASSVEVMPAVFTFNLPSPASIP